MQTVVLTAVGAPLEVVDRPVPHPTAGSTEEVLRVIACGVCHSDLHVVDGAYPSPLPLVLGHEVVAEHPDLGAVLVYAPWGCRRPDCPQCSAGQEMICPNSTEAGVVVDGGYAEYIKVPDRRYLLPLGDLDPVRAAPLACGGPTAFRATKRALQYAPDDRPRVAVIGGGGLGQFAVQFLKGRSSARVTAVDTSQQKLAACRELGADAACTPDDFAGPFDAIIDFVGADTTLASAVASVARSGIVLVVGLFGGRVPFGLGAVPNEAMFTTSIWGTLDDFAELLDFARHHPLRHSVETLPLAQAELAHQRLRAGQVAGRLVLLPDHP